MAQLIKFPFLRQRDRGSGTGRFEIVFAEDQNWDEAQAFAAQLAMQLGLSITWRHDGPDAWVWRASGAGVLFNLGYDDFPCETTLWAANPASDAAVKQLFVRLISEGTDSTSGNSSV